MNNPKKNYPFSYYVKVVSVAISQLAITTVHLMMKYWKFKFESILAKNKDSSREFTENIVWISYRMLVAFKWNLWSLFGGVCIPFQHRLYIQQRSSQICNLMHINVQFPWISLKNCPTKVHVISTLEWNLLNMLKFIFLRM